MTFTTILATAIAMLAFAANSVLCRLALGDGAIDAASFASIRVAAGAVTLGLIALPRGCRPGRLRTDWRSVIALYVYMVFFAFAYLSLSAGTGALILFGAVQLTMFGAAFGRGDRFSGLSWVGLILAFAGLVFLVSPGVTAPDPLGALLMAVAGIAWGIYSLLGKRVTDPLEATTRNFAGSIPLVLMTSLIFAADVHATRSGVLLAILSGAVASGLGYVVWFHALRGLAATQAATVQLSVPVIAALGGTALLAEDLTVRLMVASVVTLGGVAIVLVQRSAR